VQDVVDGFWKFEQTLVDESANENDLTGEGGGPAYVQVGDEYWANFDGINDRAYRSHASQVGLDPADEWGIGGRIDNITAGGVASFGVVGKTDSYGNPTDGYGCYVESNGEPPNYSLVFFLVFGGVKSSWAHGLSGNTPHSWAFRQSKAGHFQKFYFDGVYIGGTSETASPDANDDEFAVGQFANSEYYAGWMDELWVVGECPSEQDIEDIHDNGFESVYGGLSAEFTDQMTAADGLAIIIARTVNDNQVVTDGVDAQLVGLHYTKNENQIALDAMSFSFSKNVADTAAAADVTAFGRFQTAEEAAVATDALTSQMLKREFEEMGGIADQLLGFGWARTLLDQVQSADACANALARTIAEAVGSADAVESALVTGLLYATTEQFAASDVLALALEATRVEQGVGSDALTALVAPTYAELLTANDGGLRQPRPLYAELMSATDGLAFSTEARRADAGSLADALTLTIGLSPAGETAEFTDALSLEPGVSVSEGATLADAVDLLCTRGGVHAEEFLSTDVLTLLAQPSFWEEFASAEVLRAVVGVEVAEQLSGVEGRAVEAECHLAEAVATIDAVRPVLNPLIGGQVATVEWENATRTFWWEDVS
jgi:hypothetical protein